MRFSISECREITLAYCQNESNRTKGSTVVRVASSRVAAAVANGGAGAWN
jgi:hypothetical protein